MHFSHNLNQRLKEHFGNPLSHLYSASMDTYRASRLGQPPGDQLVQSHVPSPGVALADTRDIAEQATDAKGNALFTWLFPL